MTTATRTNQTNGHFTTNNTTMELDRTRLNSLDQATRNALIDRWSQTIKWNSENVFLSDKWGKATRLRTAA